MATQTRVQLQPYDPKWPEEALREAERVRIGFDSALAAIHHIGSTSVPGQAAKPIIDLLAIATSLSAVDAAHEAIASLGYVWRGEHGIRGRRYLVRESANGVVRAHVHIFEANHPEARRYLLFRDALRASPELAAEYRRVKERLDALCMWDKESYTKGKTAFIESVLRALQKPRAPEKGIKQV